VTTYQDQVSVEAATAQAAWGRLFRAAMDPIADCFARAEALGQPGPHRLQHLLSRAPFDHDRAREAIARLVVRELAGQEVVLVADETGDAKSSTGCVGPAASTPGRSTVPVGALTVTAAQQRAEIAGHDLTPP
jgi:SRSO17 transposase